MNGRLTVFALLLILIGLPVGLLHAQSNYAPALVDDDTQGVSDTLTVVVAHQGNLTDTFTQSDAQSRQAKLGRNNTESQSANEQITKDAGKPVTEPLSLIESLSQAFQSNDQLWVWAVLFIILGAAVAGIIGGAAALMKRKKPKPAPPQHQHWQTVPPQFAYPNEFNMRKNHAEQVWEV